MSLRATAGSEAISKIEITQELLRYFLIGVTLPDDKFWVNLRPDAADNIIDNDLAKTDIGKIFLETDLELKKDTARLTSPQTPEGKLYWDKLYKKAEELFGSDQINIPTLTRPWIVPNEVIVRQSNDSVYIYKATMKVMLEEDYLKQQSQNQIVSNDYSFSDPRLKELNKYSTQLVKDLILPKLTRMVNTSKKYSGLRQVFYSLVLARWFKSNFSGRSGTYSSLINKSDLKGLTSSQAWSKDTYFKDYQKSFKDGEYNLKVPVNGISGQVIRNYFSGGIQFTSSPVSGVGRASSGITNALLKAPGTELLSGAPSQITLIPSSVQALSSSSSPTQVKTFNYGRIIIEISKNEGEELTEVKFGFRDANGKDNGQRIATALNTHRKFDVNDAASEIMENLRNRINLQQADGLESFIDLAKLSLPAVIRDLYPVSGLKAWQKVSSPVSSAVRSVEAVRPLTNLLYQVGLKSDPEGFGYLAFEEDGHYKGAPRFGQLMRDALDIIYKFARRHFGHNYQNYKGDVITVGIGIGGQTTCALPEEGYVVKHNNRRLIVADSLGTDFNAMEEKLLSSLRKNPRTKLLWKVSSKSGQTDETMVNFQMVLRMMIRIWARFNYGDEKGIVIADNLIKRMFDGKPLAEKNISELNLSEEERDILKIVFSNMIMTTGKFDQEQKKGSRLDQFRNGFLKQLFDGNENEVASILMLDNLGGRFQGVSPASLTYAVLLGMNAEEILAGAREEAQAQRAGTSESAKFAEELYRRDIHHFVITAPNGLVFSRPTELLEQLIPESTGKGRKIGMPQGLQTYNFDPAHVRQAFSNIPGIERKAYFVIDLEGQEPIDVGAGPNDLVIRYKMKSVSERELGKYIQFVENLTVRYGMLTTAEVLREKQKADKSLQEVDLSNSANIAKIMQGPKQGDVQFDALKKLHEFFNEITPFRQPDVEGAKALVKQGRGFNAFNENGEKDESGLPVRSEAQRRQAYEENEMLVSDGAFLRPNGLRNGGDFVTGLQARGVLTALVDMLKKPSAPVDASVIRMEHIRGFLKQLEEMLQREPLGVPLNEFFQMVDKEKEMKRLLDLILQSTTQVKLTQTEEQTARQLAALRLKADKSGKTFNFVLYEDRNSLTEIFKKYLAFLGFDRFGFCPGEQHKSRQLTAGGVDVSLEVLMVSLKTLAKVKATETLIKSDGNVPVYLHDLFPSEVSDIYAKAYADRFNEVGTESVTMLVPDATDVNKLARLMVVFARSKQIYDQQYAASSAVEAKQVAEEFLIENLGGVLTRDDFVRLRQETKYTSEALAEAIVAAAFENNLLLTKNGGGFVITEMKNNGSVPMVNDWRALDQKQNNDKIKQEEKMRTLASQIVEAFSSKQKLTPKNSMFSSNGRLVQTFLLQRKGQVVPVEDLNRFIQVSNLNPEGFADAVFEVVSLPQARIVVEIRSKGLRISQGAGSLPGEAVTKGQILRLLNPKSTQGSNGQTSKVEDASFSASSAVSYQELQDKLSDVLRQWVWNENSGQRIDVFIKLDNMQVQSAGTLRMGFNKNQIDIDKACESILNKISQEYKTAELLRYKVERRKNLGIVIDVVSSSSSAVDVLTKKRLLNFIYEVRARSVRFDTLALDSGLTVEQVVEIVDRIDADRKRNNKPMLRISDDSMFIPGNEKSDFQSEERRRVAEFKKRYGYQISISDIMKGTKITSVGFQAVVDEMNGDSVRYPGGKFLVRNDMLVFVRNSSSSAVTGDKKGGIDFRAINIITQPMGSFAKLNLQLPQADRNINIDDELKQINKMLEAGIRPNSQRFAMVASSCIQRKELSRHAQDLALAVVKTYKLDEANSVESDEDLMKVSLLVDSI
ncbi:MAG: hypothetical protein HZC15_01540 [Candidatus Omnitrophica bacterium]|nr:hypothetical protein [Candidatus Omnitrophota bacterium]